MLKAKAHWGSWDSETRRQECLSPSPAPPSTSQADQFSPHFTDTAASSSSPPFSIQHTCPHLQCFSSRSPKASTWTDPTPVSNPSLLEGGQLLAPRTPSHHTLRAPLPSQAEALLPWHVEWPFVWVCSISGSDVGCSPSVKHFPFMIPSTP